MTRLSVKQKWVGLGLIALIIFGVIVVSRTKSTSILVSYREVAAKKDQLQVTILSTGTVEPENRLEIKPPIAGRSEQVLVNEGDKVKKGQLLAWMSSTERAALLDAASAKGPKELRKWEKLYRPTPILAPIDGTIIQRSIEPGQSFTASDAVLVMSDRLTVKAQVDETDISEIQLKQKAQIVLDAYANQMIPGTVDQIAYDAKTVNNVTTYIVDVLPEEAPTFMRSGMTANVTFLIAGKDEALTIPNEALRVIDGKFAVLVKNPQSGKSEDRIVEVGLNDGKKAEILSGLSDGEIILVAELKAFGKGASSNKGSNPFSPMGRHGAGR